jgi:hypothetical protein
VVVLPVVAGTQAAIFESLVGQNVEAAKTANLKPGPFGDRRGPLRTGDCEGRRCDQGGENQGNGIFRH